MRGFRFRFASLITLRAAELEHLRREQEGHRRRADEARARERRAAESLDDQRRRAELALRAGVTGAELPVLARARAGAAEAQRRAAAEARRGAEQMAAAGRAVVEAWRRKRVLEVLRGHARAEHRKASLRAEARDLDDASRGGRARGHLRVLLWVSLLVGLSLPVVAGRSGASPDGPEKSPRAESARAGGSDRLIEDLQQGLRRVREREAELVQREDALAELEEEVAQTLAEVESIRALLEQRLEKFALQSGDRTARLAKMYGAMPAARAAPLLEGLELTLTTEILTRMKHKKSAEVLALMKPEIARRVSRRVAQPLARAGGAKSDATRGRP